MRVVFICLLCYFVSSIPSFADERYPHPFEEWPALLLSYAYSMRADSGLLERLATGIPPDYMEGEESPLLRKYEHIQRLLTTDDEDHKLAFYLGGLGHYCWVKWQPGFSCGDPKMREFSDSGYLYVSDPIWPEDKSAQPFLIVITSQVSPRSTSIFRLYEDRVELVYDRGENQSYTCGLDEYTGLFVTYGVDVTVDEGLILTETEGFHWDMLPKRTFYLKLTADTCELVQVEVE